MIFATVLGWRMRLGILFFILSISGCTQSALFIVNGAARFGHYRAVTDISYGPSELNTLDVYIPGSDNSDTQTQKTVVIFFYGGCWGGCPTGFKEDYLFVAQTLTTLGYIVVIADYRRYPEVRFPEIIDDAAHAVVWVQKHIGQYQGDPNTLFLMGHSAGAHLAAMLTLNECYLPGQTRASIKGFIGLAGPYDFLPFTEPYQKEVFAPRDAYPQSQPINFVDGSEPPLLLLQGSDDKTIKPRNIINLAGKVRRQGGLVETRFYPGIDHTGILGSLSIPFRNQETVLPDIDQFITIHSTHKLSENSSGCSG